MNIKIATHHNVSTLFIKADFDQIVAENYNEILKALSKYIVVLTELEFVQREPRIKADKLIETIRRCHGKENVAQSVAKEFCISLDSATFLLNTEICKTDQILDHEYLKSLLSNSRI